MAFVSVWWDRVRNTQSITSRHFGCLLTKGDKGRSMNKASNPVYSNREGFLEEVMFEVKPVLRPEEGKEQAYYVTSFNSTYLATFHQPCLSLPDNEVYVVIYCDGANHTQLGRLQTTTILLYLTILLIKNLSRAQPAGFAAAPRVDGGCSVFSSWRRGWLGEPRLALLCCDW